MKKRFYLSAAMATLLTHSIDTLADTAADLQDLRAQVQELQRRLDQSHPVAGAASAFNPAISLILGGSYGRLTRDPALPATGFAMAAHPGHQQGLNLGESELGIRANIDADFSGTATMALSPAGGLTVENAYIQTDALGQGSKLSFGRFFSGLGYLNEQHAHVWDFIDQPLVYATLWNNQLGEDGVQLKWLAPSDTFVELGGELARGRGFPGTDSNRNGAGAGVLYAHIGDDVGIEHSWRAGVSLHQTRRDNALSNNVPDLPGTPGGVSNSYSGNSRTTGLDMVWKYAPNGNTAYRYLKLQGEYFQRRENGTLTYKLLTASSYDLTQAGWYVQAVAQVMPRWRTGVRYDRLQPGVATVGAANAGNVIADYGFMPTRSSWMLDYSPSEFSRIRLQVARDQSRQALPENQIFVQYMMSMGAHGAHAY